MYHVYGKMEQGMYQNKVTHKKQLCESHGQHGLTELVINLYLDARVHQGRTDHTYWD